MATEPSDHGPESNRVRLHLWFEQFRDLALIELALAGGVITLLGTVFNDTRFRARGMVSVVLLGAAAVAALIAQSHVVDLSDKGLAPDTWLHRLRATSMVLLGAGTGAFAMFTLRALGLR
jgi:hypothetical protein